MASLVDALPKHLKKMGLYSSSSEERPLDRFSLPGLNLPLNWTPHPKFKFSEYIHGNVVYTDVPAQGGGVRLFPTALDSTGVSNQNTVLPLTTLREFTMLHIMNTLTDKKGWEEKIFDETISEKWKTEALAMPGKDVSQPMVDWVIEELRWKAKSVKEVGAISVFNGDVVKSDIAISDEIKKSLQAAALKLEDIPEGYKDYHPGSEEKVLDLVHPSLFPLVYGKSRVLEDRLIGLDDCIENSGKGEVLPIRPDEEMKLITQKEKQPLRDDTNFLPYSKNFQWLPCEIDISAQDGEARITSYINNLHPQKHQDLYLLIEKVITRTIPLWNMTLTPLRTKPYWQRVEVKGLVWTSVEDYPEEPQREDGDNEDEYWDRWQDWERGSKNLVRPEPGVFAPPDIDHKRKIWDNLAEELIEPQPIDLKKDFGHRGLQVIVKLANIELSPDNPTYDGGAWHVEGQLNEHICATALYYYDSENITESRLAFRQHSSTEIASQLNYPQDDHTFLTEFYGCAQSGRGLQKVGSVLCCEGRLLTFPNILQHQVQPFTLADPTKPGHRKILALFLVDPQIRVISTANVPPQQRAWWAEELDREMVGSGKAWGKLSTEIREKIYEDVEDFPMGMEEAKEIREKLMEERGMYVEDQARVFANETFNLCEH